LILASRPLRAAFGFTLAIADTAELSLFYAR